MGTGEPGVVLEARGGRLMRMRVGAWVWLVLVICVRVHGDDGRTGNSSPPLPPDPEVGRVEKEGAAAHGECSADAEGVKE